MRKEIKEDQRKEKERRGAEKERDKLGDSK